MTFFSEFNEDYYITGLPCEIHNDVYKRKKVEFNFGFIMLKEHFLLYKDSIQQTLKSIAKLFIALEVPPTLS